MALEQEGEPTVAACEAAMASRGHPGSHACASATTCPMASVNAWAVRLGVQEGDAQAGGGAGEQLHQLLHSGQQLTAGHQAAQAAVQQQAPPPPPQ
ncbi:hypothetical protein HaLaN_08777 [Haematococcus lacustris]|uniref:Uncharacterized protein n=1 Tax=Haematococcus lacustris TaxID=44745 RepID=A0A699YS03_HAELA|nr:hypothetical protein HaLaN_08777 [Haematococcus lacustris]